MDQLAVNSEILRQEKLERELAGDQHTDVMGELAALRKEIAGLKEAQRKPAFDGKKLGSALVEAVKGYIDRSLDDVHKRLDLVDALQKRVAELEGGGIRYVGTWQRAQSYRKGDVVTYDGGMFIALAATAETPGKSGDWQLAVKAGRPGRDGKDAR